MDTKKIGVFIANLRKEKNLTQEQLAERLGVSNRSVSRWENGNTLPDLSLLRLLCMELNTSIEELLNGKRIDHREQWLDGAELLLKLLEADRRERERKVAVSFSLGIISLAVALLWAVLAEPEIWRVGILAPLGCCFFAAGFHQNHGRASYSRRELQILTEREGSLAMTTGKEMLQFARKYQKAFLKQYGQGFEKIAQVLEPGEYAVFAMVAESYAVNGNPGIWHAVLVVTGKRLLLCAESVRGRLITHYTPEWYDRQEIRSVAWTKKQICLKTERDTIIIRGENLQTLGQQLQDILK